MTSARRGPTRGAFCVALAAAAWIACGGAVEERSTATSSDVDAGTPASSAAATRDASTALPSMDAGTTTCGEYAASDTLAQFGAAGALGLFTITDVLEECTNLGGVHLVLRPLRTCSAASSVRAVHWGGHGCISAARWKPGDLAVLAVEPVTSVPRLAGVCLDALPAVDALARAMQPVSSPTDGEAILAKFGCSS